MGGGAESLAMFYTPFYILTMKPLKDFKQVFERLIQSHTLGQLSKEKLKLPYYSD